MSDDEFEPDELKTSIDTIQYICKVQSKLNKIQNKIDNIYKQASLLKKEKAHLNYRLNKLEALQKLSILNCLDES